MKTLIDVDVLKEAKACLRMCKDLANAPISEETLSAIGDAIRTAQLECANAGRNTVKSYLEIPVEIEFGFSPGEKITRDDPGCDASVEVTAVLVGYDKLNERVDLLEFLDKRDVENMEDACWEKVNHAKDIDE